MMPSGTPASALTWRTCAGKLQAQRLALLMRGMPIEHARSRCCPCCGQREIQISDAQGRDQTVLESYYRCGFAQINGPKFDTRSGTQPTLRNTCAGRGALDTSAG